jgi:hypothetical protein
MDDESAVAEMESWLRHLDRQKERAAYLGELAALARTDPAEAQRLKRQMDSSPRVYDGANLEPAVRYAIRQLTEQQAEIERLRDALAHYATDESADGWIAISALSEDAP